MDTAVLRKSSRISKNSKKFLKKKQEEKGEPKKNMRKKNIRKKTLKRQEKIGEKLSPVNEHLGCEDAIKSEYINDITKILENKLKVVYY